MREQILDLLHGKKINAQPAFSGLIHVTAEGVQREGLAWSEIHTDAEKMAKAAASTFKLTGMPSATLPLDFCSPAEALGADLIFYNDQELQFPQVRKLLFMSTREVAQLSPRLGGRIPLICDAIKLVKKDIGDKAVISGLLPGPYTLLIYICKAQNLFSEMKTEPDTVHKVLNVLANFLTQIGQAYKDAGADFITIHEMGGSPGFIGPKPFETFVLPALQTLTSSLPHPTVLSVCGKTESAMSLLAHSGADAISVDQLNDLKASRAILKNVMLFGNIDPVETLCQGDEGSVAEAVQWAKEAEVDAVWPGCDLVPQTPIKNIQALID